MVIMEATERDSDVEWRKFLDGRSDRERKSGRAPLQVRANGSDVRHFPCKITTILFSDRKSIRQMVNT